MSKDSLHCSCKTIPPYDLHTKCRKCRKCDFVNIKCRKCRKMGTKDVNKTLSSWRKADAKRRRPRPASLASSNGVLECSVVPVDDPHPHVQPPARLQAPFDSFLQIAPPHSAVRTLKRRHHSPEKPSTSVPPTPGRSLHLGLSPTPSPFHISPLHKKKKKRKSTSGSRPKSGQELIPTVTVPSAASSSSCAAHTVSDPTNRAACDGFCPPLPALRLTALKTPSAASTSNVAPVFSAASTRSGPRIHGFFPFEL